MVQGQIHGNVFLLMPIPEESLHSDQEKALANLLAIFRLRQVSFSENSSQSSALQAHVFIIGLTFSI